MRPIPKRVRKVSIREVAEAAMVSLGTVSRVINGHPSVSEEKRARVNEAILQLGYAPDMVAQSMRSHRSMTFACVMRDFTVPVLGVFVDSMQKEIDAHGFSLMYASSYHDLQREIALLRRFQQRRIDGLVIATSSEENVELLSALREVSFPLVLIDREVPVELDSVKVNHAHGVREAIHYLAGLGHQRIAVVSGEPGVHATRNRLQGYHDAMRECGLAVDARWIRAVSFSGVVAYEETLHLLALPSPPTAILAGGTSLLPGVIRATREMRRLIPEDLSVIAGADSDLALLFSPAITAIRWNHDELGKAAGRFLMDRLENPRLPSQQMIVEATLIVRGSCGPPNSHLHA